MTQSSKKLMLTTEMKETMEKHRKALMLAIRSLPSDEVLDLVAAGLVSRGDYSRDDVSRFMSEANDWAWHYQK